MITMIYLFYSFHVVLVSGSFCLPLWLLIDGCVHVVSFYSFHCLSDESCAGAKWNLTVAVWVNGYLMARCVHKCHVTCHIRWRRVAGLSTHVLWWDEIDHVNTIHTIGNTPLTANRSLPASVVTAVCFIVALEISSPSHSSIQMLSATLEGTSHTSHVILLPFCSTKPTPICHMGVCCRHMSTHGEPCLSSLVPNEWGSGCCFFLLVLHNLCPVL